MASLRTVVTTSRLQLTTHLSTPKGWMAELAWLADLQRTVYPYKWSPVSCRSTAGQRKLAGQRPALYCWAMEPTIKCCSSPSLAHVRDANEILRLEAKIRRRLLVLDVYNQHLFGYACRLKFLFKLVNFYRAMLCIARTMPSQDVCLSVRLFVRHTPTFWNDRKLEIGWKHSDGDPLTGASNASGGMKNCDFRPIYRFISKMIQDRAVVTIGRRIGNR